MRVVLYERPSQPIFSALADGCQMAGHSVVWQRPGLWTSDAIVPNAGAVVVHGLHQNGTRIRDAYRALNVPVWIVDFPRLRAEPDASGLFLDSLAWRPDRVGRAVVAADVIADRRHDTVLVCGQKPDDAAHGMDWRAIGQWARETIAAVRAVSGLPITYRPHPLNETEAPADAFGADAWSDPNTSLSDVLAESAFVVVYNSTVGWDAIAAGVPVIATADPDLVSYAPWCASLESPAVLTNEQRADALRSAAATQWTLRELRDGTAVPIAFDGAPYPDIVPLSVTTQPKRSRARRTA